MIFPLCRGKSEVEALVLRATHTEERVLCGCPWLLCWKADRYCGGKRTQTHSTAGQGFIHTTRWTNIGLYNLS